MYQMRPLRYRLAIEFVLFSLWLALVSCVALAKNKL